MKNAGKPIIHPLTFVGLVIMCLVGCAAAPASPAPAINACRFPHDKSIQFEMQKAEDWNYGLPQVIHQHFQRFNPDTGLWTRFLIYVEPMIVDNLPKPDGRWNAYTTRVWHSPNRFVFGLDGPFRLENGKIPVFVCDEARRQSYRFGPSYLLCPDIAGGEITIRLSEDHAHPEGLELAPGNMPEKRVVTIMHVWREGCVDQITTPWKTTGYCVPEGTGRPTVWCAPYGQ